jgi:hypothetical protein
MAKLLTLLAVIKEHGATIMRLSLLAETAGISYIYVGLAIEMRFIVSNKLQKVMVNV